MVRIPFTRAAPDDSVWPIPKQSCYGHAIWMTGLGIFLLLTPDWTFGPTWSYFEMLPHNGFGMGVTCLVLGVLQSVAISRDKVHQTATLIFLGAVVNWTAGILLAWEGIAGHQGLMEAPWMCTVGAYKFIISALLDYRPQRSPRAR